VVPDKKASLKKFKKGSKSFEKIQKIFRENAAKGLAQFGKA
jgi:hypothetical protein